MSEINVYPLLSREEELDLAKKIQAGCDKSREIMIQSNLRLVVKLAHDYKQYAVNIPIQDLISEGNVGLITAVERYLPREDCKFSSYAQHWIHQKMRRYTSDNVSTVRIPAQSRLKINNFNKLIEAFEEDNGRKPNVLEICEMTGEREKTVRNWLPLLHQTEVRLDVGPPENSESNHSYDHFLKELCEENAFIFPLERSDLMDNIAKTIKEKMSEREYMVLALRFGVFNHQGQPPLTLEETSKKIKRTRERVRQIQFQAIDKLKKLMCNETPIYK